MFENKTFETILSSMLNYVSEKNPELDTRIGSVIYTALAPIALELESAYHEMDMIIDETFMETASKEYLVKHGNQLGLELREATCAHFKGEFNAQLEIGTRFRLDKFNYTVINFIEEIQRTNDKGEAIDPYYIYELVCETAGAEPNDHLGKLTPITYVEKLSHSELTSVLVYGEDEEDTEQYRYRLQVHAKNPPSDGNVAQYNEWLDEYDGVGKYKVFPCWNGINTVKLSIVNTKNRADSNLVEAIQEYFDPVEGNIVDDKSDPTYPQGRGMGNGKASIGSIVTVVSPEEVNADITARFILKDGYDDRCLVGVKDVLESYFTEIAFDNYVDYMKIYAKLSEIEGIKEIFTLKIVVGDTIMDTQHSWFIPKAPLYENQVAVLGNCDIASYEIDLGD